MNVSWVGWLLVAVFFALVGVGVYACWAFLTAFKELGDVHDFPWDDEE